MLTIPIKKKWFEMILSGEKKEEYREIKLYWTGRFRKLWQGSLICGEAERTVRFRNGYGENVPSAIATVTLSIGEGKAEWGAVPGNRYYILHISQVNPEQEG